MLDDERVATVRVHATREDTDAESPYDEGAFFAAVIGAGRMARGAVVSKVWEYIKANKLMSAIGSARDQMVSGFDAAWEG